MTLPDETYFREILEFESRYFFRQYEDHFEAQSKDSELGYHVRYEAPITSMQIFFREDTMLGRMHAILKAPRMIENILEFKYLLFCKLKANNLLHSSSHVTHRARWEREPVHPVVHFGEYTEKVRNGRVTI